MPRPHPAAGTGWRCRKQRGAWALPWVIPPDFKALCATWEFCFEFEFYHSHQLCSALSSWGGQEICRWGDLQTLKPSLSHAGSPMFPAACSSWCDAGAFLALRVYPAVPTALLGGIGLEENKSLRMRWLHTADRKPRAHLT